MLENELDTASVSIHDLTEKREEGYVILDVREPDERDAGFLDASVHIPLSDLPIRCGELDEEAPIVVYCRSGNRSKKACQFLNNLGFEAYNLEGGMLSLGNNGNS